MTQERYRCPCCGYHTLPGRGGYDICPVCFWEDDNPGEEYDQPAPERPTGPNHVHLWQARRNYQAFGASEEWLKAFVRTPLPEEMPH